VKVFGVVWLGSLLSLLAMQFAGFAVGLSTYQRTASVSLYGLMLFATTAPLLIAAPIVGAIADRWNRGRVLALGRAAAAVALLVPALFARQGAASTGLLIACLAIASAFQSGEFAILSAIAAQLFDKHRLPRVNGLLPLGLAISQVVAPPTASFLAGRLSTATVLLSAVIATSAGAVSIAVIRVPAHHVEAKQTPTGLLTYMLSGWQFVRSSPGLLWLLVVVAAVHFTLGILEVLVTPWTLAVGDTDTLGAVLTAAGIGMMAGSAGVLLLGTPKKRAWTIMLIVIAQALVLVSSVTRPSALLIGTAAFAILLSFPILASCFETTWQLRVPSELQGRVFALRNALTSGALPVAQIVAGPLSALAAAVLGSQGSLSSSLRVLLGAGPGRGAALVFLVNGGALLVVCLIALIAPHVRRLDAEAAL